MTATWERTKATMTLTDYTAEIEKQRDGLWCWKVVRTGEPRAPYTTAPVSQGMGVEATFEEAERVCLLLLTSRVKIKEAIQDLVIPLLPY